MSRYSVHVRYATLAAANLFAGVIGFLSIAIIGSRFGPGGLGDVALATSILAYALILATGGTELYAIRKVAASPETLSRMISSVIVVRLILSAFCFAALTIIATIAYPERWQLILLFGLSLLPAAISTAWVPQVLHQSGVFALANVLTQAVFFSLLWTVIQFNGGLPAVAISKLLAELLIAGCLIVWLYRTGRKFGRPLPWTKLRQLVSESMPIAGTQLARGFGLGTDLVILAFFVSRDDTGQFAAAFKIFGFMLGLGTAYFVILLPKIAQQPDRAAMARELRTSFKLVLPSAIIGSGGIALLAAPVIHLLFGPSFASATTALQLLCLAWLLNIIGRHYRQVLLARNLQGKDFQLSLISCGVHLGARLVLIPFLGITGAAIGMVLGELYICIAQRHVCRKELAAISDSVTTGSSPFA